MPSRLFLVERVSLVGQVGHHDIRPAIVVVVGEVDAHAGIGLPFGVHRNARLQADLLEGSIRLLVEEKLRHRVVGDVEVDASVAVVVRNGDAESFGRLVEPELMRNLGEMTVAVVVIHEHGDGLKDIRVASSRGSLRDVRRTTRPPSPR